MADFRKIPMVRSLAWRVGRWLYCWARREGTNSPRTNGEYLLLERVIAEYRDVPLELMDIGANVGDWTGEALKIMAERGVAGCVHAFEPASSTFIVLSERFAGDSRALVSRTAFSAATGTAPLYIQGPGLGINSLVPLEEAEVELVRTTTVDAFLALRSGHIALMKIDTEGYDLQVLLGAQNSLRMGRFTAVQFEYNHRWAATGSTMQAVFALTDGSPYRVGKLHTDGIELFDAWHPELERFIETNYVLVHRESKLSKDAQPMFFDAANVAREARDARSVGASQGLRCQPCPPGARR